METKTVACRLLLYYITDRTQFPGSESQRRTRLLGKIAEAARCDVAMIQLREKDLSARELESLARDAMRIIRENTIQKTASRENARDPADQRPSTRLLINSRTDVAIAAGADGVHLRSDDLPASEARVIFSKAGVDQPIIGVSCHTVAEVRMAEAHGADFAVFGPVFEKIKLPTTREPASVQEQAVAKTEKKDQLRELRKACGRVNARSHTNRTDKMPVLALGGITLKNANKCIAAGAAGIAAIRVFQENDIDEVVTRLQGV